MPEIRLSSSAHETSFAQEDGESDDSDSNKKDSRENIIQIYKQIEVVDNEEVGSADDQNQNSSQGSQHKPYVKPINQEAPEERCKLLSLLTKNQSKSDQINRL